MRSEYYFTMRQIPMACLPAMIRIGCVQWTCQLSETWLPLACHDGDTWQDPFYLGFVQFLKVHRDDPAGKSEVGIWLCGRSRSHQSDFLTAPYQPLWIDRDDDEIRQLSRPPGTEKWIQRVDGEDILEMELALDPKHTDLVVRGGCVLRCFFFIFILSC